MNWLRECIRLYETLKATRLSTKGGLLKPEHLSENSVLGNEIKDTFVSGCERKGLRIT